MKKNQPFFCNAYKMMFVFLGLFIVLLVSISVTLIEITHLNDNIVDIKERLSFLGTLQWVLLIIGILLACFATFSWLKRKSHVNNLIQELRAALNAISKSQAIIEFNMDGTIITANDKFLNAVGYSLDEIAGEHHNIFVDKAFKESEEYKAFWKKLNRGEYEQAEYKRLRKGGKEVWLQSSYNPILDDKGQPIKVIKIATDITKEKMQTFKLAQLMDKLQKIGLQVLANSNDISVGINQLEATATSQAASASQQAASVTEISATIEEIKATTQQTLIKAKQLGESASKTTKEGEKGRESIENMAKSMNTLQDKMQHVTATILSLNDKTQQISEITEVVADIAKQSKMLALNASIEAAKAGESGKGFAVVAGEVKELAGKSQLSTERVQKILQDIRQTAERAVMVAEEGTKSVNENIRQVEQTGDIINSLANVIEESSMASMQIVSAVREESIGIEQVDISIKEIDKVTSLFSSATEQTQQAILSLSHIAVSLRKTASAYKTEDAEIKD